MSGIDAGEVAAHSVRTAECKTSEVVQETAANDIHIRLT